jgi:hypothetical protein
MATEQLLFGSVSIGSIFTNTIGANQFIRLNGNTTNSSNTITNVADNGVNYFGVSELRVGMELISSGPFPSKVTITNISGASPNATITVSGNAQSSNTGRLLRVDPGPGQIFIESGSMVFPAGQTNINASSVTGSSDTQYQGGDLEWGIAIPVALDGNASTQRVGQFAQFSLANVQSRPAGVSGVEVNMYLTSSGGDMNGLPTGMTYFGNTSQCVLYQIGSANKVGPMFQGQDASISNAFGFAPGQIMAANVMDALTSGSGGGAAFPYTGSGGISGSIDMTGSAKILLNSNENFLISNAQATSQSLFNINNEGVATFRVQPDGSAPTAVEGGLYFTTASAYIGIK